MRLSIEGKVQQVGNARSARLVRSASATAIIAAALTGIFFTFCGVALAFEGQWSRIPNPILVAIFCAILVGMGAAFLYLAWRLFAFGMRPQKNVA